MMPSIKILKRIRFRNPVLIAAWPGMGDVALKAAHFLKEKLKAVEFARLPPRDYFRPSGVWIDKSIIAVPQQPDGIFYHCKNTATQDDILIFLSDSQPTIEKAYAYAGEIAGFARRLGVRRVYTFAAMPLPIEHTQMPGVHMAATDEKILDSFVKAGARTMPMGQISGLNGLVLGAAKERGLEGVCLLGEIPLYTIQIENPLASLAVLSVLCRVLGMEMDFSALKQHAEQMTHEIEYLIDYLKNPPQEASPIDEREVDSIRQGLANAPRLPDSARSRIEEIFRLAKKDLSRSVELKQELDKWNVYEEYEDSFLDLFKKPSKKDN